MTVRKCIAEKVTLRCKQLNSIVVVYSSIKVRSRIILYLVLLLLLAQSKLLLYGLWLEILHLRLVIVTFIPTLFEGFQLLNLIIHHYFILL